VYFGSPKYKARRRLAHDDQIEARDELRLQARCVFEARDRLDRPQVRKQIEALAQLEDRVFRTLIGGPRHRISDRRPRRIGSPALRSQSAWVAAG
jgi:hypothetical protein